MANTRSSKKVAPSTLSPHHNEQSTTARRRRTNSLRADPKGDTSVPALATMYNNSPTTETPSPIEKSERPRRGRKRRKVKSLFRRWKSISLRHTWLNPLIACFVVVALYLINPSETNPVYPALFLSYPLPRSAGDGPDTPIQYGKGGKDFAFVAFYTVFFSFTREFTMQRVLRPLAIRYGMKTKGKQFRFMEQAYTALYFAIMGPLGVYVMSRTPIWYFNTTGMYEGFPHKTHEGVFKAYYLIQAAYWVQQAIVLLLLLEKPRKDFKELVAHHIITVALIWLSYRFHFTYMGVAIYITHDISDFMLATSKVLNYVESPIVIPYFVLFLATWAYLRHYVNLVILNSLLPLPLPFPDHINEKILDTFASAGATYSAVLSELTPFTSPVLSPITHGLSNIFPETTSLFKIIPEKTIGYLNSSSDFASIGDYVLNWETQQYKCWIAQYITFGLLLALQLVNLFWFYCILRILWRLLITLGEEVSDVRSEEDESEADERAVTLDELRAEQGDKFAGETGADIGAKGPEVHLNGVPVENGKAL